MYIKDSYINSEDFCWKSDGIKFENCKIEGINLLLDSSNINVISSEIIGKYAFQYVNNINIFDGFIDSENCLWNSKNAYLKKCKIIGDRLGWYSENLVLEECHIESIKPFSYCKRLKLINCTMNNSKLCFEYSDVEADIHSHVESIKNVLSGKIIVDSYEEYINDSNIYDCKGIIETRKK